MIALLAVFALLTPLGSAQQRAHGKLFVRIDDGVARAAVQITIEPGYHIYHGPEREDLGQGDVVGAPTIITLAGEGIEWGPVEYPEPHVVDGMDGAGDTILVNSHEGTVTFWARGAATQAARADAVTAKVVGLVCDDVGCVPYDETLTSEGRGSAELFAGFPAAAVEPVDEPQASRDSTGLGLGFLGGIGGGGADKASAKLFVRVEDGVARAAIEVTIEPGWHLYHGPDPADIGPEGTVGAPTEIELAGPGIVWERVVYPAPEQFPGIDDDGHEVLVNTHEGTVVFYARGSASGSTAGADVTATIEGLTCDDEGCVPYSASLSSAGRGPDAVFAAFPSYEAVAPDAFPRTGGDANAPMGTFLLVAVLWGLITLLMPCTYPMIPITISFFTKQAIARDGKVIGLSLLYGLGIVLMFILIGVVLGPPILVFATHPVTNLVIGLLFVLFAFALFGVIDLQPPRFLLNVAGKASMKGGAVGVFLMGVTLVVTSFTCTAPFVGSLLSFGAQGGSMLRVVLGMGVFGLTMAIPFVILSLVPGKLQKMPKAGEWMHVLKVFLGFVELAAALKFLSNTDLVWDWQILSREIFLLLWFGIFVCAAMFLFGWIRLQGEEERQIGPTRMVSGIATLLFALYCGFGFFGFVMDDIMTAIIPPYSSERIDGGLGSVSGGERGSRVTHTIVVDDYAGALESALSADQLLLVNFTGVT